MRIRGAGLRSTLLAVEQLHGAKAVEAIKGAMPEALRSQIEPAILPVQWYPVEVAAALQVGVRDKLGGGRWDLSHKLGAMAARIDFTGLYRVFVRSVQYDTIWDRAERAWSAYNSQGDARWVDRGPTSATGMVRGVSGYNMGLWQSVAGRIEGLLQLAGVKAASVEVADASSTHARIEAIWVV